MRETMDVGKETVRAALSNNLTGEAAKVAFYLFLSFFPALLVLLALTGLVGGEAAFERITAWIETAVPENGAGELDEFVAEIALEERPGILSVGVLLLLWSASNVFMALADGLNAMYGILEGRSWWKARLMAIALFLVGSVVLVVGALAVIAGPELVGLVGLGPLWGYLVWPPVAVLVILQLALVYHFLPARDRRALRKPVLYGAVAGTALWLVATLLFRLYVTNFDAYASTYGVVGGVIILLMWLFLTALTILLGGQLVAVLEGRAGRQYGARARPQPA